MIPTLLVGDYLSSPSIRNGYSKHSFPFSLGVFSGRIFGSPPERGDVAVFKYPGDQGQGVNRTDYIKRIVGMPGDRIQVTNGLLHINGVAVDRKKIGDNGKGTNGSYQKGYALQRDAAQRPPLHGAEYRDDGMADNTPEFLVPANSYFVMGDNRDDSLDSRTRLMLRDFSARRAIATNSAGTCPRRTSWAAPSSSSSRTTRRPQAGWSHGNGLRRYAGTASSWQSTEFDRRRSDGAVEGVGHLFVRPELAAEALTHRSALDRRPELKAAFPNGNERLEFLGDRVLSLAMADLLLRRFPQEREGELARRHASLVRAETLLEIATAIGLGEHLRLGDSERAHGHGVKPNILSDALEALLGAVFLDAGLEAAAASVELLWGDRLSSLAVAPRDPKTALQEWRRPAACPCRPIGKSNAKGRRMRRVRCRGCPKGT